MAATKLGRSSDAMKTTPWAWRDSEGAYVGWNGEVWLYRTFPLTPLSPEWEDLRPRLSHGQRLETALAELGEASKDNALGIAMKGLGDFRQIHIISINWEAKARSPKGTPAELAEYQNEVLNFLIPQKVLMVGVRLRGGIVKGNQSLWTELKSAVTSALGEATPDMERFASDRRIVESTLSRNGMRKPTEEERRQLESWYNLGRGPDALIYEHKDHLAIDEVDSIEFATVRKFNLSVQYAGNAQWIADAEVVRDGVRVVSVRADLEPASSIRRRARQSQRKIQAQIDEEIATGDIDRPEYSDTFQLAQAVEEHFISSSEPILSNCSIIMARRAGASDETYVDFLRSHYQIEVQPLSHRQLPALDETLPTSSRRANPFPQDLTLSMIAYAGMMSFSDIGDRQGVYVGLAQPNLTPVYIDPAGAPAADKPPSMFVFGDPGSGKTFLCQNMAYQASLAGVPVIYINPKGFDTLSPLADLAGGRVITMSKMASTSGTFDPFRFCSDPEVAADVLNDYILSVLTGFNEKQELALSSGLREGALAGARCAREAIAYVKDPDVIDMVRQQVTSSASFALGFGIQPKPPLTHDKRLMLIEFDRNLDLPDPNKHAKEYTRPERITLATIRLVIQTSLELLITAGGGMLIVDEAWVFLNHPSSKSAMQRLGRLGRSLNLLPVFATQRVADLLGSDMESYLSRVIAMALQNEAEASAALRLCGLEVTRQRLDWLANAGPRRKSEEDPGRWAMGLHRDLNNRHSAVLVGPTPPWVQERLTTNPQERKRLQERLSSEQL